MCARPPSEISGDLRKLLDKLLDGNPEGKDRRTLTLVDACVFHGIAILLPHQSILFPAGDYFDRAAARGFCEAYCNFNQSARIEVHPSARHRVSYGLPPPATVVTQHTCLQALKRLTQNHLHKTSLKVAAHRFLDELQEERKSGVGSQQVRLCAFSPLVTVSPPLPVVGPSIGLLCPSSQRNRSGRSHLCPS